MKCGAIGGLVGEAIGGDEKRSIFSFAAILSDPIGSDIIPLCDRLPKTLPRKGSEALTKITRYMF